MAAEPARLILKVGIGRSDGNSGPLSRTGCTSCFRLAAWRRIACKPVLPARPCGPRLAYRRQLSQPPAGRGVLCHSHIQDDGVLLDGRFLCAPDVPTAGCRLVFQDAHETHSDSAGGRLVRVDAAAAGSHGLGAAQLGKPLAPPSPPNGALLPLPLAHLWFLWLLFWFYPLFIGSRWMLLRLAGSGEECRRRADTVVRWICTTAWGPVLLALPLAIGLYQHEAWRTWEGIPTPDRALVPNLPALLAYGTAFGFGWLLHRQTHLLQRLARHWLAYLSAAVILTAICIALGGSSPATALPPLQGVRRMAYIGGYGIAVWCWTFALVGAAMRFLSKESPRRRYLSDSSYWLYLVHLPLIFGLQAMVMRWNLHWSIKFSLIMAFATPILLLELSLSGPAYLDGLAAQRTPPSAAGAGSYHPNGLV